MARASGATGSDEHGQAPTTHLDEVTKRRWGSYLADVERRSLLRALEVLGPGSALDVGCAGGRWAQFLDERGWSIVGTDIDAAALAVAQTRLPDARFVQVDQRDVRLPLADGEMSLVLCIENPVVMTSDWFLPEVKRVLESGGVLVGTVTNTHSWRRMMDGLHKDRNYWLSYEDFRKGLHEAGFTVFFEEAFAWLPFRRGSDSRLIPICTALERRMGFHRLVRFGPWVAFCARVDKQGGPTIQEVPPL
jgi:SAM-dependent methyltransferase